MRLFSWIMVRHYVVILTPLSSISSNFTPFNSLSGTFVLATEDVERTWWNFNVIFSAFGRSVRLNSNRVCPKLSKDGEPEVICTACTLNHITQTACCGREVSNLNSHKWNQSRAKVWVIGMWVTTIPFSETATLVLHTLTVHIERYFPPDRMTLNNLYLIVFHP